MHVLGCATQCCSSGAHSIDSDSTVHNGVKNRQQERASMLLYVQRVGIYRTTGPLLRVHHAAEFWGLPSADPSDPLDFLCFRATQSCSFGCSGENSNVCSMQYRFDCHLHASQSGPNAAFSSQFFLHTYLSCSLQHLLVHRLSVFGPAGGTGRSVRHYD